MAASKSSRTICNFFTGVLVLCFISTLIIIIVWATSPYMKDVNQCKADLKSLRKELEDAKVTWEKDKKAMEGHLENCWDNQTMLNKEIQKLDKNIRETNTNLSDCQQQNVILMGDIATLENETEILNTTVANLTSDVQQLNEDIILLKLNLTQISHQLESSEALRVAAESKQKAADSQKKSCETLNQHLNNKLSQCKSKDKGSTVLFGPQCSGSAGQHTSAMALLLFISFGLILS